MTSAAWAWIGLAAGVVVYVAGYDLWAHYTGHPTMTHQMHDWLLYSAVLGPVLIGGWVAAPVALVYHFFTRHYPKG